MKWVLRGLFVSLLVAAMLTQAVRVRSDSPQRGYDTILSHRVAKLGPRVIASTGSSLLIVTVTGCREPVAITYMGADGSGEQETQELLTTDVVARYVYLGSVTDKIDPFVIGARWATASALEALGLRRGDVPRDVVAIMMPKACPELANLDWSVLSPWTG